MHNKVLQSELREYKRGEYAYINALREKGIVFAERGRQPKRIDELRDNSAKPAPFKNAGASIVWGWQSKACVECTGNKGSETFSTTFKCHRDCYFCFNYNVADYDKFVREGCPWRDGLDDAERRYGHDNLAVLGLTGGEPLLVLDDSIALLEEARQAFPVRPQAHVHLGRPAHRRRREAPT